MLLQQGVKTAIDISDGLIADLTHICHASHIGASIKKDLVPIHPALLTHFETECYQLALTGGEDYELLFTADKDVIARAKQSLTCPVTIIGEITDAMPGKVTLSDTAGNDIPLQQTGWEHFISQT